MENLNFSRLAALSNQQVIGNLRALAAQERRMTVELLHYINELERRRCHLEIGFASAFDFLTRELGYSESAAWRRIQSARLLRSLPELESKIDSGVVNLSTLSNAQRLLKAEEKRTGQKVGSEQQAAAIAGIEHKSARDADTSLKTIFPEAAEAMTTRAETLRVADEGHVRLHVTFTTVQMKKLHRLREVLSHRNFGASLADLIEIAIDEALKKRDPLKKATRTHSATDVGVAVRSGSEIEKRAIPSSTRKYIFKRDEGRCQFRTGEGHSVCGQRYQVEIDHILPRALGGSNKAENLRLLCRAHNQHMAEVILGKETMQPFRKH